MTINKFELPPLLEANLNMGRAQLKAEEITLLGALLTRISAPSPAMFDHKGILVANRLWSSKHVQHYLGSPSQTASPGNIDPQKALIIGEAEPDSPIALDYRADPPRVIYFGDIDHKTYWLELASSYEALISKIRSASTAT